MTNEQTAALLITIREPLIEAMRKINTTFLTVPNIPTCEDGDHVLGLDPLIDIVATIDTLLETLVGTSPSHNAQMQNAMSKLGDMLRSQEQQSPN